jgi:hypothetical protein
MALSAIACLAQGWVAGAEGFSPAHTLAIVAAYVLDLAWMMWLAAIAWRMQDAAPTPPRRNP